MKVKDYRDRLTEVINERRELPFAWGTNDCMILAADVVLAITGKDFAVDTRGKYDTPEGGIRILKRVLNQDNISGLLRSLFEEAHVAFARPGDIVYRKSNLYGFDMICGICNGLHSFFLTEDEGLTMMPTLDLDGCFRVD